MHTRFLVPAIALLFISAPSMASTKTDPFKDMVVEKTDEVCGLAIAKAVFKKASKRYGKENAETLNFWRVAPIGEYDVDSMITAYKVVVTDEVGESDWLVVAETEDCVIEYIGIIAER